MGKIVFITGTDTGVGKTVLTALLLHHLRDEGRDALAMKPFCSGGRGDARLLRDLQKECLTLDEVNPFHFRQPLAPWIAARNEGRSIGQATATKKISALSRGCEILLVEGAGGLLSPLGPGYSLAELATTLPRAEISLIIVARNRLGTINHVRLTVQHLQVIGVEAVSVVLMDFGKHDISAKTNTWALQKVLPGTNIFNVPNLNFARENAGEIKKCEKKLKKRLQEISGVIT